MNREVYRSTPGVQHMMGGGSNAGWWNLIDMRELHSRPASPLSSSVAALPDQYPHPPLVPCQQDGQDLPQSYSQLLLGGLVEEGGRCGFPAAAPFNYKKVENNWKDLVLQLQAGNAAGMVDVKQERYEGGGYVYGGGNEDTVKPAVIIQHNPASSLAQALPVSSPSPGSCITSLSASMLEFSNNKSQATHPRPDHSSECNSTATGSALKRPRIKGSASAQSTFKVKKEKVGDRITVLHQLVSPFGKTDTASVLLEAIGYIRFLQGQIEALSSPYLGNASGTTRNSVHASPQGQGCIFPEYAGQDGDGGGQKRDLRSRGLCLVPISCTMHVGGAGNNGADCWAPALGAGLR